MGAKQTTPKTHVSGIGCLCALGSTFPRCMEALFGGKRNFRYPTLFSSELPDYPVFEIDDHDVVWQEGLSNRGRTSQLAMVAANEALRDAGYTQQGLQGIRVGVCIGTTVGNSMNNENLYRQYHLGHEHNMSEMDRYFQSNPAQLLAHELGLNGPTMTVANACSSGTDAIGIGCSWLNADVCDIVLAGGSDELSHISYLGFISLMVASKNPCAPFDTKRDGLNLGEGAAMLVLEKETEKKPGRGRICGYGASCDAYHVTTPHPKGRGLRRAISEAMHQAGAPDIAFINAHGTGTIDNDRVEMQVFEDLFPEVPFFSTKGYTGHTLGAAGAIEAAITLGCLQKGELPSSIGFAKLPEEFTAPPVFSPTPTSGEYALSQSLAFGGSNGVLLVQREVS